jgi:hypothetical protein
VPCCRVCNHAKHTMKEDVFKDWLKRVFKHQKFLDELEKEMK